MMTRSGPPSTPDSMAGIIPQMPDVLSTCRRIFECDDLLVLDKPAGIALLADRSGAASLWDALQAERKSYLVHRLDKGTSGVLLIARTQARQKMLTRLFNARQVGKFYLAKVVGQFPAGKTLTIDLPLKPGRKSRYRVAGQREDIVRTTLGFRLEKSVEGGFEARTRVRCLASDGSHSLVLAQPLTGRTHQLRVHLSWIGFPIVGDHLYGRPQAAEQTADRLHLHCHRLVIPGYGSFRSATPFTDRVSADPWP